MPPISEIPSCAARAPSVTTPWCRRSSASGNANMQVYGADKVWKQMNREGSPWPAARSSG
jgi:hypothetical protein